MTHIHYKLGWPFARLVEVYLLFPNSSWFMAECDALLLVRPQIRPDCLASMLFPTHVLLSVEVPVGIVAYGPDRKQKL